MDAAAHLADAEDRVIDEAVAILAQRRTGQPCHLAGCQVEQSRVYASRGLRGAGLDRGQCDGVDDVMAVQMMSWPCGHVLLDGMLACD